MPYLEEIADLDLEDMETPLFVKKLENDKQALPSQQEKTAIVAHKLKVEIQEAKRNDMFPNKTSK